MVHRQGLAPGPYGLRGRCSAARARDAENGRSIQPRTYVRSHKNEIGAGGETCTPVEFPLQFTKLPLSLLSHAGKMVEHQGIAPCIPVWKTGVYLSTLMLGNWNPVRELHPPLRFCGPPPELIGQRDELGEPCGFRLFAIMLWYARCVVGQSSDCRPHSAPAGWRKGNGP